MFIVLLLLVVFLRVNKVMNNFSQVAILLCTKNGSDYISEQLQSYLSQTNSNWSLWVSDDGSEDETCNIISKYRSLYNIKGRLLYGPRKGFSENFMSLVCNPNIQSEYYAFSDQDDIWKDDKLERAIKWLDTINSDLPALYCARTSLIDSAGEKLGFSPNYKKPPGFGNSIVQNIASGNTMVFNNRARELLRKVRGSPIVAHDWTLYQIVTGCGGAVYFDTEPTVFYRQHDKNAIGNGGSYKQRFVNFIAACNGRKVDWADSNFLVLSNVEDHLTDESKKVLSLYKESRNSNFIDRLKLINQSTVYHQNLLGKINLYVCAILNRL